MTENTAQSLQAVTPVVWADAARAAQFGTWLAATSASHGLLPESLRLASADASFRRYLRIDDSQGG
ncbi:MAG: aminoglycoside phosphotransferase, partial [Comamonas sp.]